jgi:hypothetical protein
MEEEKTKKGIREIMETINKTETGMAYSQEMAVIEMAKRLSINDCKP